MIHETAIKNQLLLLIYTKKQEKRDIGEYPEKNKTIKMHIYTCAKKKYLGLKV